MAYQGMDVEAVRSVASGLNTRSQQISAVVGSVDALVSQLAAVWVGPDAQQFAGWWNQQHKPGLVAAAEAVHGLGQSASNNATEQEHASGGSGSSGPGATGATAASATGTAGAAAFIGRALHGEDTGFGLLGKPGAVHDLLDVVDHSGWADGHSYADQYNNFLHGVPDSSLMKSIGYVGTGFGVAASGWDAYNDFRQGDVGGGVHDTADSVGTGLQGVGNPVTNPIPWLVGTNIKVWSDVIEDAHQIDFHQGLPNPLSGNNFTEIWIPGAAEGFTAGVKQIFGDL